MSIRSLLATAGMVLAGGAWAQTQPADAEPPRKLAVGTEGFFQPGILLQGWFLADRADETTSTFRVRRAELHLKGEIIPGRVGSWAPEATTGVAGDFAAAPSGGGG